MSLLITKLVSIVSSDFYCFSLKKKTHLVLVYNMEIMAAEITVIDLGEHRPEERITGSKTDLDLSARSTYTRVYTVVIYLEHIAVR